MIKFLTLTVYITALFYGAAEVLLTYYGLQ